MTLSSAIQAPSAPSLRLLVRGFVLTCQTEGRSPRTVEYYGDNLRRFLWYAEQQGWPEEARLITPWHIRDFLGYVGGATRRWGLEGNGSESSRGKASHSTLHHYYRTLRTFFNWAIVEGFLVESPITRIHVKPPQPKVVQPYSEVQLRAMLKVCEWDYTHNAKLLGSRNRAIVLTFLDTGLRLSELAGIRLEDVDTSRGLIGVVGKGAKERVVRIGQTTQKALWRYLMHRPDNGYPQLWLSEEGRPLRPEGIQMVIKRLKARAGIKGEGGCHRFRHTFALNFLRADRNPFNLQYLLGHSDLDMVRHYTAALGMEDALEAHIKASPADLLGLR